MKKKVVVFTGAGISKESGIDTFRDKQSGLWYNFNVDDVATPEGWKKNKEKVLTFYNERRRQLPEVQPNDAHKALAELEKYFDVTVITQNVDDLHERGGSSNIIHLHGELTKVRGTIYESNPVKTEPIIDIGYNDVNLGDKCPVTGSQLRPHIVWFNEFPFGVGEAYDALCHADILLIIGTSLQIGYTISLLNNVSHEGDERYGGKPACKVYYIDPSPMRYLDNHGLKIKYIEKTAVEGVTEIVNKLIAEEQQAEIEIK